MDEYISDLSSNLECNIISSEYEQLKDDSAVISFTDGKNKKRVAKISHNITDTYEYDISTNINLKYVNKVPVENHFRTNKRVYTVYPYIKSELVNWSKNSVVERFIHNLADLMYSFHIINYNSLQSKLKNNSQIRDKSQNRFKNLERSTKSLLNDADILSEYGDIITNVCLEIRENIVNQKDLMITHGDVYIPNMIQKSNGNIKYVIDLDSTCYGYIVYDIGKAFSRILRLHETLTNYGFKELMDIYYNHYKGDLSYRQKRLIRLNDVLYSIREYARAKSWNQVYEPWPSYESTGDGIKRHHQMAEDVKYWYKNNYL